MLEDLIQLDKELFLFLNGLGTPTWDGFWMFITKTRNSAPLYILLLYLSYKQFGWKKTGIILVAIALPLEFLIAFAMTELHSVGQSPEEDLITFG